MTANFNAAQSKQTADGFFSALFDFAFSQYITLKFARVIYLISAVFIGLCWGLRPFGVAGYVQCWFWHRPAHADRLPSLRYAFRAVLIDQRARHPRIHGLGDQDGAEHFRDRSGAASLESAREAV